MIKRLDLFLYLIICITLFIVFYEFKNYMSIKEYFFNMQQLMNPQEVKNTIAAHKTYVKNAIAASVPATENNIDNNLEHILLVNGLSHLLSDNNEDQIEIDCNIPFDMIIKRDKKNKIINKKYINIKNISRTLSLSDDEIIVLGNESIKGCVNIGDREIKKKLKNMEINRLSDDELDEIEKIDQEERQKENRKEKKREKRDKQREKRDKQRKQDKSTRGTLAPSSAGNWQSYSRASSF